MPFPQSYGYENHYYSFSNGLVHFIQLDTETSFPSLPYPSTDYIKARLASQLTWLKWDLNNVNRTLTPWIIVGGNRPWYTSSPSPSESEICTACRPAFEPLLQEYGVDLYLSGSGDVGTYERMMPLSNGTVDAAGLVKPKAGAVWYITNGAGAAVRGEPNQWIGGLDGFGGRVIEGTEGWSRVTVRNCSHLEQEFVASQTGVVLDRAVLVKERVCG
jgi:hypothetical protein